MAGKEASKDIKDPKNCRCCQAEAACSKTRIEDPDFDEQDLGFLDNGDAVQSSSPDDDFRFPSPVKNMPTLEKSERDLKSPDKSVNRANTSSAVNQERQTSALEMKPVAKSANTMRTSTIIPKVMFLCQMT